MIKSNLKINVKFFAYFLSICIFLAPNFSFANFTPGQCSKEGYTIATINGINTNDDGARNNMIALGKAFGFLKNGQTIDYQYLLNPSHTGGLGDIVDVANQKLFENFTTPDYDLIEMWNDASKKVTTQKLLLVGHSQGNFYANDFYGLLIDKDGGVPKQSLGVYGVASPANYVAGGGKYITSNTDSVINNLRIGGILSILPSNVEIVLPVGDTSNGHSFSDVYLKYQGDKIISEIKSALDKLSENNIQNENNLCIIAPKIDLGHKIDGAIISFFDHPVSTTNTVATYIATGIYNTSIAIGNTTIKVANAITSSISSLTQLLFNNPKNLAVNNPASAIAADNQLLDTSQSSTPEPVKENSKPTVKATPLYKITAVQSEPETTETAQATLAIAPAIEIKNTTTEEKVITSNTSQNLYPNLLPGGGGVAASNISIPNPVLSPVVPDSTPSPTIPDTIPPIDTVLPPADTTVLPPVDITPPPLDTTPPNTPIITTSNQLVNTNSIVIVGTAENNSIIIINGGTGVATAIATDGNYSIEVVLNQNTLNTLNVTATDAANNTSNLATVLITHDNIPPVINYLNPYTSPAYTLVVGGTFYLTVIADAAGYTAGPITVNDIPMDTFIDNASGFYTVTHKVTLGEADRSAGAVPVSVVLTDAAGNSNIAYSEVTGNSIAINGHFPASVAQIFPSFNSNGKFTQNVILDCVSNSGYFEMYYIQDSDSTFRMMNLYGDTVLCPGNHQTFVSKDFGFDDFGGYQAVAGWYYGIVSIGNPNCDIYKNNTICVDNNIQSFFRLHRNAAGVWSDTNI